MAHRPVERAAVLSDWLRVLTPAQREAVMLCWVDGYTMREAGERLGVTHSAVRNRLRWARLKWGIGAQKMRWPLYGDRSE